MRSAREQPSEPTRRAIVLGPIQEPPAALGDLCVELARTQEQALALAAPRKEPLHFVRRLLVGLAIAERRRFELLIRVIAYDGLANRWFQPLTHLSKSSQNLLTREPYLGR